TDPRTNGRVERARIERCTSSSDVMAKRRCRDVSVSPACRLYTNREIQGACEVSRCGRPGQRANRISHRVHWYLEVDMGKNRRER
ncbi:hypothetical protein U1Q18_051941, partial [Sarracenia purpurea var. burkii]